MSKVTVGLRIHCRLYYSPLQGGGIYADDVITLACLSLFFIFCILLSVSLPCGVGQHYETLSAVNQVQSLKWNAILNAITPWMCTLPKFAIIATLKRILNYGTRTTMMLWTLALTSQATVVALMVWGLVQCGPVAFQWDKTIDGGTCINPTMYGNFAYFTYAYSTALDVFFCASPDSSRHASQHATQDTHRRRRVTKHQLVWLCHIDIQVLHISPPHSNLENGPVL